MCAINARPVLFALSNPTSQAECTAEAGLRVEPRPGRLRQRQPVRRAVTYDGREFHPGQGNNAYVFPGIGLGVIVCRARRIPEEFFLAAARTLADLVTAKDLQRARFIRHSETSGGFRSRSPSASPKPPTR